MVLGVYWKMSEAENHVAQFSMAYIRVNIFKLHYTGLWLFVLLDFYRSSERR